jgi:hypothetical protein
MIRCLSVRLFLLLKLLDSWQLKNHLAIRPLCYSFISRGQVPGIVSKFDGGLFSDFMRAPQRRLKYTRMLIPNLLHKPHSR